MTQFTIEEASFAYKTKMPTRTELTPFICQYFSSLFHFRSYLIQLKRHALPIIHQVPELHT